MEDWWLVVEERRDDGLASSCLTLLGTFDRNGLAGELRNSGYKAPDTSNPTVERNGKYKRWSSSAQQIRI